ncbi:MAG: hypothetical protein ACRD8Z_23300 [Nitrososphaeraceae archaeon]
MPITHNISFSGQVNQYPMNFFDDDVSQFYGNHCGPLHIGILLNFKRTTENLKDRIHPICEYRRSSQFAKANSNAITCDTVELSITDGKAEQCKILGEIARKDES